MTNEELEKMMAETVERMEVLDDINRMVMQEVKAGTRKAPWRVFRRMVLFALGVPLGVGVYAYLIYKLISICPLEPYYTGSIVLSALACLYFIVQRINNFSLSDV